MQLSGRPVVFPRGTLGDANGCSGDEGTVGTSL